jgi:hypothetical protein
MIGHTKVPDHLSDDRLGNVRDSPPPSCCVLLAAACTKPAAVHQAIPVDSLPPSMTCQAEDCHDLGSRSSCSPTGQAKMKQPN